MLLKIFIKSFLFSIVMISANAATKNSTAHPPATINNSKNITSKTKEFRVGFFLGGRTGSFLRFWLKNHQNKEGLIIELLTKNIRKESYYKLDPLHTEYINSKLGKATGDELVDLVMRGEADAALIGETAFIKMVHKKIPLVAIAETGHDVTGEAGHGMIFQKGIDLKNPQSWKGLTFGARRSAGGDLIVLKEFLSSRGLNPEKDVKIIDQIDDDKIPRYFKKKKFDASYVHLSTIRGLLSGKDKDKYQLYGALDWIKPEISQAILVINPKFLKENEKALKKLLKEYSNFIISENKLPAEKRLKKGKKGIQLEENFFGMNYPQSYDCPYVRTELLEEWQKILVKHKFVKKHEVLNGYINNSLFECKK
jgi:ABC-type nitrate/sulfonate/bicarbonate transport system substrate-binding protein